MKADGRSGAGSSFTFYLFAFLLFSSLLLISIFIPNFLFFCLP